MKPTPEDWDALQMLADLYAAGASLDSLYVAQQTTCLAKRYVAYGFPSGTPRLFDPNTSEEFLLSRRSEYEG